MKKSNLSLIIVFTLVFSLVLTAAVLVPVSAQDQAPAAETPTDEPIKPTATEPPTPTPSSTPIQPTVTSTPDPEPSEPVPIPEPITVVLFGTGLAALSAAAAARRKKD